MKGAEWTIHERAGNDFDQANVLVELLRASGIPAYFVYGTVIALKLFTFFSCR
jgi:transglutaminase-like putative cysteine protease